MRKPAAIAEWGGGRGGGCLLAANCKDRRLLESGINQTSSATPAKQVPSSEIPTNEINFQKDIRSTSLVVQWLRLCFQSKGGKVQSLVGELRSHMPLRPKKPKTPNIVTNSIKT